MCFGGGGGSKDKTPPVEIDPVPLPSPYESAEHENAVKSGSERWRKTNSSQRGSLITLGANESGTLGETNSRYN